MAYGTECTWDGVFTTKNHNSFNFCNLFLFPHKMVSERSRSQGMGKAFSYHQLQMEKTVPLHTVHPTLGALHFEVTIDSF